MVATQNEGALFLPPKGKYLFDLYKENGAGEGIRTLDFNLGKVALYP